MVKNINKLLTGPKVGNGEETSDTDKTEPTDLPDEEPAEEPAEEEPES